MFILELSSRHSVNGVLPPIKIFFSRDDELNQVRTNFWAKNKSVKSVTFLTGMSGIGKIQLAG